jgi:methyl-accepting chemotaxis protein
MFEIYKKMGFGTKILCTVLILFFISMGTMGGLTYNAAKDLLTNDVEVQTLNMAQGQAENMNNWLNTRMAEVSTLANLKEIESMDWKQQLPVLQDHHQRLADFYELIYVVDKDGICRQSTGAVNDISDRSYFKEVMKGKTLVSDPVISKSTGNAIAIAITPIKDNQGNILGAVGGVVNTNTLKQMVEKCKVGETGYAYLVQKDGLTIAHPDKTYELKRNLLKEGDTNKELFDNLSRMSQGETGLGYYTLDGQNKLIAYAPISLSGWSLGVTVPTVEINSAASSLLKTTLMVGIICLLVVAGVMMVMSRFLVRPIKELAEISGRIAEGDLSRTVNVTSHDEIGQLGDYFNAMVLNLKNLVQQIMAMTEKVAKSTEELATAASESGKATEQVAVTMNELAKGTASEAEMTQETVLVVADMTKALENVEVGAQQVSKVSKDFQRVVEKGMQAVTLVGSKMEQSVRSAEGVEVAIRELDTRSKEIGQIVEVITNIAGQTNLLALNAAIEAARAGEQGRGFAVVADEVRKLAEGSAEAANQISQIIRDIQNSTEVAVNETATSKEVVKAQAEAVDLTEKLFRDIEVGVNQIDRDIEAAIAATNKMSRSVQKIVQSVESISAITEESAASAEEVSAITEEQTASAQMIASSAHDISDLVDELQNAVRKFRI